MDDMLKEVIRIAGGVVPLARTLGVTHQSVYQWKRIPLQHVFAIEELTDISREYLRPDVYRPRPTRRKLVKGKRPTRRVAHATARNLSQ
jgi:DNA-binding transcriptional regulator YdaS (Cro superfamily)